MTRLNDGGDVQPGACACHPTTVHPVRQWRQFCDCRCGLIWIRLAPTPTRQHKRWSPAMLRGDGAFYGTHSEPLTPTEVVRGLYPECDVVMAQPPATHAG